MERKWSFKLLHFVVYLSRERKEKFVSKIDLK